MSDAATIPPSYVIVVKATLDQLEASVRELIGAGYMPAGGPFNATAFCPPHGGVAQAMVHRSAFSNNAPAIALKSNTP